MHLFCTKIALETITAASLGVPGLASFPTGEIRHQQRLGAIPERLADLEHRPALLPKRRGQPAALMGEPGNLVDVPADGRKLGDAAPERQ